MTKECLTEALRDGRVPTVPSPAGGSDCSCALPTTHLLQSMHPSTEGREGQVRYDNTRTGWDSPFQLTVRNPGAHRSYH